MAKAKKRTIACKEIGLKVERDSREYYVKIYNDLLQNKDTNGKVPRGKIREKMAELGAWSEDLDELQDQYNNELEEALSLIEGGGITIDEAKAAALDAQLARLRLNMITNNISEYDVLWSFESASEEAKNIYLIVNCLYYKDDESPVFDSIAEFDASDDEELISRCVKTLNSSLYGEDGDYYKSLPETKFLHDYGFLDDEYKLIEKDDSEELFKPFLDGEGNPVEPAKKS